MGDCRGWRVARRVRAVAARAGCGRISRDREPPAAGAGQRRAEYSPRSMRPSAAAVDAVEPAGERRIGRGLRARQHAVAVCVELAEGPAGRDQDRVVGVAEDGHDRLWRGGRPGRRRRRGPERRIDRRDGGAGRHHRPGRGPRGHHVGGLRPPADVRLRLGLDRLRGAAVGDRAGAVGVIGRVRGACADAVARSATCRTWSPALASPAAVSAGARPAAPARRPLGRSVPPRARRAPVRVRARS